MNHIKTIDKHNAYDIYCYFKRFFKRDLINHRPINKIWGDTFLKAKQAFGILEQPISSDNVAMEAFQQWIIDYIPMAMWQRCLNALCQQRYKQNNHLKRISIRKDTWFELCFYAEALGITQIEAIDKAIRFARQAHKQQHTT